MKYPVTLNWDTNPHMERWNEVCAWSIEHFGLPGGRYTTEIDADRMTWHFDDARDQLIFILAWGRDNTPNTANIG
jgi:hypothetical protein